jgi:hypothetical protein
MHRTLYEKNNSLTLKNTLLKRNQASRSDEYIFILSITALTNIYLF